MQRQVHISLRAPRRGFRPVKIDGWTGGGGARSAEGSAGTARDFGRAPRSRRAWGTPRGCRRDEPLLERRLRSATRRQEKSIGAGWAGVPGPWGDRALGLERRGLSVPCPGPWAAGGRAGFLPHPHAARWEATTISTTIAYHVVVSRAGSVPCAGARRLGSSTLLPPDTRSRAGCIVQRGYPSGDIPRGPGPVRGSRDSPRCVPAASTRCRVAGERRQRGRHLRFARPPVLDPTRSPRGVSRRPH